MWDVERGSGPVPDLPSSLLLPACEQEQSTIAKLGLELRLLSSDLDAEVDKWEEQEHELVRQSQSLASMAYNMHLFTR